MNVIMFKRIEIINKRIKMMKKRTRMNIIIFKRIKIINKIIKMTSN